MFPQIKKAPLSEEGMSLFHKNLMTEFDKALVDYILLLQFPQEMLNHERKIWTMLENKYAPIFAGFYCVARAIVWSLPLWIETRIFGKEQWVQANFCFLITDIICFNIINEASRRYRRHVPETIYLFTHLLVSFGSLVVASSQTQVKFARAALWLIGIDHVALRIMAPIITGMILCFSEKINEFPLTHKMLSDNFSHFLEIGIGREKEPIFINHDWAHHLYDYEGTAEQTARDLVARAVATRSVYKTLFPITLERLLSLQVIIIKVLSSLSDYDTKLLQDSTKKEDLKEIAQELANYIVMIFLAKISHANTLVNDHVLNDTVKNFLYSPQLMQGYTLVPTTATLMGEHGEKKIVSNIIDDAKAVAKLSSPLTSYTFHPRYINSQNRQGSITKVKSEVDREKFSAFVNVLSTCQDALFYSENEPRKALSEHRRLDDDNNTSLSISLESRK